MINKILVVGYGSVGKKYADAFNASGYKVSVLDPYNFSEKYNSFNTWSDVYQQHRSLDNVILSDLAETRYNNLNKAMVLNPKRVLLEKIVTNDLKKIKEINKIAKNSNCKFLTHLRWNILNLDKNISKLANSAKIGKFCALNVIAGNSCLSVGGAHWIALYLKLLNKSQNILIQSNIAQCYDSPRSKYLSVLSGNIHLNSNIGDLNLIFHRLSRVAPQASFLFEGGFINFSINGELELYCVEDFSKLKSYQYKKPKLTLSKTIIFENVFEKIVNEWNSNKLPNVKSGLRVSEILLAAIKNNRLKAEYVENIIKNNPSIKYPIT